MSCGGRAGGITAAKACGGDFCCAPKPCSITSCGAAQCCPSQRTSFCRSSAPMLECCGPCCCCPSPASIPLPCCPPKTYCNPPPCPPACRKGYVPSPAIKLPPHCLCPARCAPVPCCQKQCVVISRCACPPKPVIAEGCCGDRKVQGPMRLPYVAPPCPIASSCAPADPPAYGL